MSGVTTNGGQRNVVYVATKGNSVYANDAQSGQVLLYGNLGAPVPYHTQHEDQRHRYRQKNWR